jgi:hypothetical protein
VRDVPALLVAASHDLPQGTNCLSQCPCTMAAMATMAALPPIAATLAGAFRGGTPAHWCTACTGGSSYKGDHFLAGCLGCLYCVGAGFLLQPPIMSARAHCGVGGAQVRGGGAAGRQGAVPRVPQRLCGDVLGGSQLPLLLRDRGGRRPRHHRRWGSSHLPACLPAPCLPACTLPAGCLTGCVPDYVSVWLPAPCLTVSQYACALSAFPVCESTSSRPEVHAESVEVACRPLLSLLSGGQWCCQYCFLAAS